jgi:hypothetical protein
VELVRAQLAQGEAVAAVATLRDAHAGPIGAMGLYEPRSDIDYWMARAFAAAAMPDSARVYVGYVRRAWAAADLASRRRLTELGGR